MRIVAAIAIATLCGCVDANVTTCDDGRVCPASTVCDDVHDKCVLPEQLTTCRGMNDGIACQIAGRPSGVCKDEVCLSLGCGDGVISGSEQCDGTVPAERDACTENGYYAGGVIECTDVCTLDLAVCSGRCGDGILNGDEACDDAGTAAPVDDLLGSKTCVDFGFYNTAGLACSPACTYDVDACTGFCGDGMLNGAEACDGTQLGTVNSCDDVGFYDTDPVTCSATCTLDTSSCDGSCGDGLVNGGEACDPGASSAASDDNLAGKSCQNFAYYSTTGLACSGACTFDVSGCSGTCGDGIRNGTEECDDAGTVTSVDDDLGGADCTDLGFYNTDTLRCSAACGFDDSTCTGYCGDRVRDPVELCEGTAPPNQACMDYGFESGALGCFASCAPDFRTCHRASWTGTSLGSNTYNRAWASGPDDVFLVGDGGSIVHWDGTSWTAMASGTTQALLDVWGTGPSDVYAVGMGGTLLRYNGTSWSAMSPGVTGALHAVWATGPTNIYALGVGEILHYDGLSWTSTDTGFDSLTDIWGAGGNDIFAVGAAGVIWYSSGSGWGPMSSGASVDLTGVVGFGPTDVYAVGWDGTVLHFTGTFWVPMNAPTVEDFYGVAAAGGELFALGQRIHHWDGSTWSTMNTGAPSVIYGVWANSPADVIVTSSGGIRRYDGEVWRSSQSGTPIWLTDVWGSHRNNVFAVGYGTILRFDGVSWTSLAFGASLMSISGISFADAITVGLGGEIRRWTGSSIQSMTSNTTSDLHGVWQATANDAIAVGDSGVIMRWDGITWAPMTSPTTATLRGVWGSSTSNVFAVGDNGIILRSTGTTWTPMTSGTTQHLRDVWGSGPTDVYAVGQAGTVLHWNGATWTAKTGIPATLGIDPLHLNSIWGRGPADVFVAGTFGTIFHWDGTRWARMDSSTASELLGIGGVGDEVFAVGPQGELVRRSRACGTSEVRCSDGRDDDCDGRIDCADTDCASNPSCTGGGVCSLAQPIACGAQVTATTTNMANLIDRYACSPMFEAGNERMYALAGAPAGSVTVSLTAASADLDLVVLAAAAGGGCEVRSPGCLAASSTSGGTESVTFTAEADKTYYLVVDGYGASAGAFALDVACP